MPGYASAGDIEVEMPELHIAPTVEEAARGMAAFIVSLVTQQQESGRFTIALSGGSTPRRLYEILGAEPHASRIPWEQWHVFWGDERCVPPDHPESNYRMAREALLDRAPIPQAQVFRMRGENPPHQAAAEYEQSLRKVFPERDPVFDLILLGIGEDGHTASLFHDTEALNEENRLVVANWVPPLGAHRITFTLPLINAARNVVFLVTEGSKAEAVRQSLESRPGNQIVPAALVRPTDGSLHWFLTADAAAGLRRP